MNNNLSIIGAGAWGSALKFTSQFWPGTCTQEFVYTWPLSILRTGTFPISHTDILVSRWSVLLVEETGVPGE